jgi:hypothetical protein
MLGFVWVALAAALGQSHWQSEPVPAAKGPAYDVNLGATSVRLNIPSAGFAYLNGVDVGASIEFRPHLGAMIDSNFVRTPNILGAAHQGYVLTLHGGPVFYPVETRSTRLFVRALGGMGLVDGAVPEGNDAYRHGWVTGPSYVLGGGVEHAISGPLALRFGADYLRTSFFNNAGTILPQNNLRVTASIVFSSRRKAPAQ